VIARSRFMQICSGGALAVLAGRLLAADPAAAPQVPPGSSPRTVMVAIGKMYARIQSAESQARFCAGTFPEQAPAIEAGLATWRKEDGPVIQTALRYQNFLRGESPALKEQEDRILQESLAKMRGLAAEAQAAACKNLVRGLEQESWRDWRRRDPDMYEQLEHADDILRAAGVNPPE